MAKDFSVTITNPERADLFDRVFGSRTVHVMSPFPEWGDLPGLGRELIYKLDLYLITGEQREKMIEYIAEKFDYSPEDVERDLERQGVPILARDCIVTVENPYRWL